MSTANNKLINKDITVSTVFPNWDDYIQFCAFIVILILCGDIVDTTLDKLQQQITINYLYEHQTS